MTHNPDSHLGAHEDFEITKRPEGYYWTSKSRCGFSETYGPFETSERAYEDFHNFMGWERMDQ